MWLRTIDKEFVSDSIKTKEIASYENVKVLSNSNLGNILISDDNVLFSQKDISIYSEMLAHIPLCTHPLADNVLLIGYNTKVLDNILKHKGIQNITVLESNKNIISAINEHFSDNSDSANNSRVKIEQQDIKSFLENENENTYDVVFLGSDTLIDEKRLYILISNVLKQNGILASKFVALNEDIDKQKKTLTAIGEHFKILMPYYFSMPSNSYFGGSFIFASNRLHPTADMILDKSDFLDDLEYYNGDIHKSSFTMPTFYDKEFRNFIKK